MIIRIVVEYPLPPVLVEYPNSVDPLCCIDASPFRSKIATVFRTSGGWDGCVYTDESTMVKFFAASNLLTYGFN